MNLLLLNKTREHGAKAVESILNDFNVTETTEEDTKQALTEVD